MERYFVDCRDYPGKENCTLSLAADTKDELLEAVVEHGKQIHGYKDTPEFRKKISGEFKTGPQRV